MELNNQAAHMRTSLRSAVRRSSSRQTSIEHHGLRVIARFWVWSTSGHPRQGHSDCLIRLPIAKLGSTVKLLPRSTSATQFTSTASKPWVQRRMILPLCHDDYSPPSHINYKPRFTSSSNA